MSHRCYRCGIELEEGIAFCPDCNAPQIRVAGYDEEPATPPLPPGTPGEVQPPAEPVLASIHPDRGRSEIDWPQALPGAATAGALVAISWLIPFVTLFLWMLAGGAFAVALYRRRRPNTTMSNGAGARVGAVSGLLGFGFFAILMAVNFLLMRGSEQFRAALQKVIQQSTANSDPRAQEMIRWMTTPEGLAVMIVLTMVMFMIAFVILSSIGGAIGAALFRRKD